MEPTSLPAAWYPDPEGTDRRRWWDGTTWGGLEPRPAPPTPPASHAHWWAFLGAATIAVGAFLPWMSMTAPIPIDRSGIDVSSGATLNALVGGVIFVMAAWGSRGWSRGARIAVAVLAALAAVATVQGIRDVAARVGGAQAFSPMVEASVGLGLWLSLGGVVLVAVGLCTVPVRSA